MRQAIRNLNSDKPTPPRFCDVVIDGDEVQLEVKTDKNKYETISWEDMQYQVNAAIMLLLSWIVTNLLLYAVTNFI